MLICMTDNEFALVKQCISNLEDLHELRMNINFSELNSSDPAHNGNLQKLLLVLQGQPHFLETSLVTQLVNSFQNWTHFVTFLCTDCFAQPFLVWVWLLTHEVGDIWLELFAANSVVYVKDTWLRLFSPISILHIVRRFDRGYRDSGIGFLQKVLIHSFVVSDSIRLVPGEIFDYLFVDSSCEHAGCASRVQRVIAVLPCQTCGFCQVFNNLFDGIDPDWFVCKPLWRAELPLWRTVLVQGRDFWILRKQIHIFFINSHNISWLVRRPVNLDFFWLCDPGCQAPLVCVRLVVFAVQKVLFACGVMTNLNLWVVPRTP